ncbi:aminopeptidase Ey-like [Saccoglossus kowalevskii]|uniref:Aminopeptidase n=1 Tax=Saccoglossus kowalevskii TaxID=10224 RepID=A0ABM0MLT8_SACKO|nr:PREDICTED: aminopeptidase N-like [Saccoglossus kowalevskii]
MDGDYGKTRSTMMQATIIILWLLYCIPQIRCDHAGVKAEIPRPLEKMPVVSQKVSAKYDDFGERLPTTLAPYNYRVWLQPYFTAEKDGAKFLDLDGNVDIYFNCLEDTRNITVHYKHMTILKYELYDISGEVDKLLQTAGNATIDEWDLYIITAMAPLQSGVNYRLYMEYIATVDHPDLWGLYYGHYVEDASNKTFVGSQLEATAARRVFPCFDEPALKATFDTTLVYRPEYVALSNTDSILNDTYYDPNTDEVWSVTYFATTVKMSTYLNAYTVGDWACVEGTTRNGIKFRVWTRPSFLYKVEYALEAGMIELSNFEDLWNIAYPLEKMDMSALPDFSAGAMENWGLIFYQEAYLLYSPVEDSPAQRKIVAQIIAHELAHQWFGNLVTLEWWSHTWLNEGFATYYEYLATDWVEPGFEMYEQFFQKEVQYSAFSKDQQGDSRPLIMDVGSEIEILGMFDTISYSKGGSIIMLMGGFLGEQLMFEGFRNYLNRFAYDNAVSDDLWGVLTETVELDMGGNMKDIFGYSMKELMDPWTLQMGFPVVNLTRTSTTAVQADQGHFLLDHYDVVEDEEYGNLGYVWHIPLTFTHEAEKLFTNPNIEWLHLTSSELTLVGANDINWYIANVNQTAFIRVNYDLENWRKLTQQLLTNHKALPVKNRAHLINDALVLGQAQQLDHVVSMEIIQYLYNETEYIPWQAYEDEQYYTKYMLWRTSTYGLLQQYIRYLVSPNYASLGWYWNPTDDIDYYRRLDTLRIACDYNHVDCVADATYQYSEWMAYPDNNKIHENMRRNVYCTAIRHGGETEWNFAYNRQKTDLQERIRLRSAMGCTQLEWLLIGYMEEALEGDEFSAELTIGFVRDNSALGFSLAWSFTVENFVALNTIYGDSAYDIVWEFADKMNTDKDLLELNAFGNLHSDMPAEAANDFNEAVKRVETNILWSERNEDDIRLFLESVNV